MCLLGARRDGSPGTLSDLRSASVNNTRLASVAVLHQIHTFIRHCSSPLFHDIGLFVEQLQQAVSDQEKKIIEQQKVLREQQQRQADAAAGQAAGQEGGDVNMTDGQEGSDVCMTDGQACRKQKASEEDLNDLPAKRTRSNSSDSLARHNSSPPVSESASEAAGAATGNKFSESAVEAVPAAPGDKQPSDDPTQIKSTQPAPATQAQPTQLKSAQLEPGTQAEPAQIKSAQTEPLTQPDQPAQQSAPAEDDFQLLDDSIQRTLAQMTDEPDTAAVATSPAEGGSGGAGPGEGLPADPIATIKDVGEGVEHPLGGPKPDKPKRRKKFTKDSVRVCASSLYASLYNTFSFAAFPLPYTCCVESL